MPSFVTRLSAGSVLFACLAASLTAQSTWEGDVSASWNDAGNWSTGLVPDAATDVVIPDVAPNPGPIVDPIGGGVCLDLTLASTATLEIQALATLEVHRDLDLDGSVVGQGGFVLVGATAASVSSVGPVPSLEVDKTGDATITGTLVVSQTFVLTAGTLDVGGTLDSAALASFNGGSLTGTGSLELDGGAFFQGTAVLGTPPAITCSGDWTADAAFAPTGGTVVFDGTTVLGGTPAFHSIELAIGASLDVAVPVAIGEDLRVRGNATLTATAPLDIGDALTVDLGGELDLTDQTHTIGGSAIVNGDVLATTGALRFDGTTTATVSASTDLPDVVVAKDGVSPCTLANGARIAGTLTLESGALAVGSLVRVDGDAFFTGGSFDSSGTLDLLGDATWSGTSSTSPPTISCRGDWTADEGFAPDSATVTLDALPGSPQAVRALVPGTAPRFDGLTIAAGADVTFEDPLVVDGTLTVTGLATALQPLDCNGTVTVSSGAILDAGTSDHTFGGDVSASGQIVGSGTFTFDENRNATLSVTSGSLLPSMSIEKTGGTALTISGTVDTLSATLVSGTLAFGSGTSNLFVQGNASFLGGTLSGSGILDVDGDVVFSGTVCVSAPTIRCAGDWTADPLFAPSSNTVTFDGLSPQAADGTALIFHGVTVVPGSSVTFLRDASLLGSLTVNGNVETTFALDVDGNVSVGAQGTFDAGSATHTLGAGLSVSGNLLADGAFVFDGDTDGFVSSDDALPDVTVDKTGSNGLTLNSVDVDGDLTLLSGPLTISSVVDVTGQATMQGGSLLGNGTLHVDSDVVFAGTQSSEASPSFVCSGHWTGHPNFVPLKGTVTFDAASTIGGTAVAFHDLVIASTGVVTTAVDTRVRRNVTVNGSLQSSGAFDIDSTLTVFDGDVTLTGGLTHHIGQSLFASEGALFADGATLVFDGTSSGSVTAQFELPTLIVQKTGLSSLTLATGSLEVVGDLVHVSGSLSISATVELEGNASFGGGVLSGNGTLSVDGDVSMTGTFSSSPPDFVVRGDWTADAFFQPTSGRVAFDGAPAAQQILGSQGNFHDLFVDLSASVTSAVPVACTGKLELKGDLDVTDPSVVRVDETLTTSSGGKLTTTGPLDVEGDVANSASMEIGGGDFAGDLILNGSFIATGPITLDGDDSTTLTSLATLPSITVDKLAPGTVTFSGGLDLSGTLEVLSGTVTISNTVDVDGDAVFSGGTLTGLGLLDVSGDVVFDGAIASTPPDIELEGDFTTHPLFVSTARKVTFDGPGGQERQILGSGGFFHDVTVEQFRLVTTAADLTIDGILDLDGTFETTGTLDLGGDLVVGAGVFAAGPGTHRFAQDINIQGDLSSSGLFVFDGESFQSVVSSAALPSLRLEHEGTVTTSGNIVVAGDVELLTGLWAVSSGTTTVEGTTSLIGGKLSTVNALDCDGDVVFAGTRAIGSPDIRVAGNWTGEVNFNPTGGTVTFDGSAPQVIGGDALSFASVVFAPGSSVSATQPIVVGGTLLVEGTASFETSAPIDVRGNCTVNTAGTFDLGSASHRFAASFACSGALVATGEFQLVNESFQTISSAQPVPSLLKTGVGTTTISGTVAVAGSYAQQAGTLQITSGRLEVAGPAAFEGGVLVGNTNGVLDAAGDVTFSGATATSPPRIECGGNWTSDSNFTPASGLVRMDGAAPASITSSDASPTSFSGLDLLGDAVTVIGPMEVRGTSMLVQTGSSLIVSDDATAAIEKADVTVNGRLRVDGGGTLLLGEDADVVVTDIGFLTLAGSPGELAVVDGLAGEHWSLTVRGTIDARDFLVLRPDENGLLLDDPTLVVELRAGTFDRPRNTPGATLLAFDLSTPDVFENLTFQNSAGATNVFNATALAGTAPVTMLNAFGAFSGESFEDDPTGVAIDWTSGSQTELEAFTATAGPIEVTVSWATSFEGTVDHYEVEQSVGGGPFVQVGPSLPAAGPSTYQVVDSGLIAGVEYTYQLVEVLPDLGRTVLGTVKATPFSPGLPANIATVGPNGEFATIDAALAASTGPDAIISIEAAGSPYDPFMITSVPAGGLKIVSDGTGVVVIDASTAPVLIANVPSGEWVEIADLEIDAAASSNSGLVVQDSAGLVLLDELDVQSGIGVPAVRVVNSGATVLQRCVLTSATDDGLDVAASSDVTISDSVTDGITVTDSVLLTAEVIGPAVVSTNSTVTELPGIMPRLEFAEFASLADPFPAQFEGTPNAFWFLLLGFGFDKLSVPVAQMPILFDLNGFQILSTQVTDPQGLTDLTFQLPQDGSLLGMSIVLQAANQDLVTGIRMSNAASVTIVP